VRVLTGFTPEVEGAEAAVVVVVLLSLDLLSLLHAATPATMANERTATPRIRLAE
jgi:hypothetical protein